MNTTGGNSSPMETAAEQRDGSAVSTLERAAQKPGVDECDLVCDALPGLLCKDLSPADAKFIDDHVADCGYCRRELEGYRKAVTVLDACCACEAPKPPVLAFGKAAAPAWYGEVDSPIGRLFIATTDAGVCEIEFASTHTESDMVRHLQRRGYHPIENQRAIVSVAAQLEEYFNGKRDRFEVPLDFSGVSPFTKSVLLATSEIPFGRLSTYQEIAKTIGKPSATRAVGNALGRNPIPVIVPCHRIVRSDSSIGGYTGGLHIKQRLLKLEGVGLA